MRDDNVSYLMLDANIALHFQRADNIDWIGLTSAEKVVLLCAPVFLREIEKHRYHNAKSHLRNRADKYSRWISSIIKNGNFSVRDNVTLEFIGQEPQIDFNEVALSRDIQDDQLIASGIDYSRRTNRRVVFVTSDVGLQAKLMVKRFDLLEVNDKYRLPVEVTESEKELVALRRDNEQLRNRVPKLHLFFEEKKTKREVLHYPEIFKDRRTIDDELESIKQRYPRIIADHSAIYPKLTKIGNTEIDQAAWRKGLDEKYNNELESFLVAYEKYLVERNEVRKTRSKFVKVNIILSNDGSQPASDIRITLTIPDCVTPFLPEQMPGFPNKPVPPQQPLSPLESPRKMASMLPDILPRGSFPSDFFPQTISGPTIKNGDSVEYWLKSLAHLHNIELAPFLLLPIENSVFNNFCLLYKIYCKESPTFQEGQLHFDIS